MQQYVSCKNTHTHTLPFPLSHRLLRLTDWGAGSCRIIQANRYWDLFLSIPPPPVLMHDCIKLEQKGTYQKLPSSCIFNLSDPHWAIYSHPLHSGKHSFEWKYQNPACWSTEIHSHTWTSMMSAKDPQAQFSTFSKWEPISWVDKDIYGKTEIFSLLLRTY